MTQTYYFVSGQIRSLQSRLLDMTRLDRMIGAGTPEEAFRVMAELQYAEYFDDSVRPADFLQVIDRGLLETKELLVSGTENALELQIIWLKSDVNNLKRALKAKIVEGKHEIENFETEKGYSQLGTLAKEDIESLVWGDAHGVEITPSLLIAVRGAERMYKETESFQAVESKLDRAYIIAITDIAKRSKSAFLKEYVKRLIDSFHIRACFRSVLIQEESLPEYVFIPGGTFVYKHLSRLKTFEELKDFFTQKGDFYLLMQSLGADESVTETMMKVERGLSVAYKNFLHEAEQGEVGSIQIPFVYFERRLDDAKKIKFIMYGKYNGLDRETIYNTIKHY